MCYLNMGSKQEQTKHAGMHKVVKELAICQPL